MSAAMHTPGPWRALHDSVKAGRFNVCPTVTSGGSAKGIMDDREVAFANARLIAAAPELLAALILLEREMVESGNAGSTDHGWKPAIEKTRAAIANATGSAA